MDDSTSKVPSSSGNTFRPTRSRAVVWITAQILTLAFGIWSYLPTLNSILEVWGSDPDYSHGYLVVPVALALLWSRRDDCPKTGFRPHWAGLVLLVLAGFVRFAAGRFYLPELDGWSIPFWIGGVVLLFHGGRWFRWSLPAIAFLWFATPLPTTVEIMLSTPLQHLAAIAGSWSLRLVGQPAIAEGTTILLNEHVLDIERACSGLRMFYGIAAMAVACVIFTRIRGWAVVWILLATGPIAIAANVFRITLTGLLLQAYSGSIESGFSHDLAGYLMIPVAMLLFALFIIWLFAAIDRLRDDRELANRWISKWLLAALALIGAFIGWGSYQQRHMLSALLEKAIGYEQRQEWPWAAMYLERYLQAVPDDQSALERYADVLTKTAKENRRDRVNSIALSHRVWKQNPKRTDLARNAAHTAYEIGATRKAIQICEELLQCELSEASLADIKLLYADALLDHFQSGSSSSDHNWRDLTEALEATRSLETPKIYYEVDLARIWQEKLVQPNRRQREKYAWSVMDELVSERPENPMAWLARYQFFQDFGPADNAKLARQAHSDLEQALFLVKKADPAEQTAVYLAVAADGRLESESEQLLKRAIAATPANPRPYVMLSELKRRSNAKQQAVQILEDAIEAIENEEIDLLLPLASLQMELEDYEAAENSLKRVENQISKYSGRANSKLRLGAGLVQTQLLRVQQGPYVATRNLESLVNDDDIRLHRQLSPKLFARAHLQLARLYRSVGILDRASEQYRSALQLDSESTAIRTEAIVPVLNSGDFESAELLCRQLLRTDPNSETALTAMIRLHVRRQLRLPIATRNWELAGRAFERAQSAGVPPGDLLLVEVELLEAQGKMNAARKRLEEALIDSPEQAFLWRESAMQMDRFGETKLALEAADRFVALQPGGLESQVLKATLLEKAGRNEEALALLKALMDESSGSEWLLAAQELARLQLLLGNLLEAKALLQQIHEREPTNLVALNALANLAWATEDWEELKRYELLLVDEEGESGALWRYHRGQRLLEQATSTIDPAFETVNRLSHELQQLRPRWSKTSLLIGNIALRSGRVEAAIAAYQRAWDLGDRSALLADRLIELLNEQGRESEAQSYVLQVQNSLSLSSQLFDRAIPYYVRQQQAAALRLAKAWVARKPNDAAAHLRLGRVHMALSVLGEAESEHHLLRATESFRQTLQLDPEDIGVWLANVTCAKRMAGVSFELADVLADLSGQVTLEDSTREFVLAQVCEELEEVRLARKHYRKAEELTRDRDSPEETARVLGNIAAFYLDVAPSLAEAYAQESLSFDKQATLPREVLLRRFSGSNQAQKWEQALTVLEDSRVLFDDTDADFYRRVKSQTLIQLGNPSQVREAIELLETVIDQTKDDRVLLASAYEKANRIGPAFETMSRLASDRTARPTDHIAFLEFWQKHFVVPSSTQGKPKFASVAEAVYKRLQQRPSQQGEWLRLKLRELAIVEKDNTSIGKKVRPYVNELVAINEQLEPWSHTAQIAWYRSLLQTLFTAGYAESAYDLARDPPASISSPEAAITICHALILSAGANTDVDQAYDFLSQKMADIPQRSDLALAVGDFLFMAGRYELAVETYQVALSMDPQNKLISNNLALALAELPNRLEDASALLSRTLDEHGPDAILLDTQSVLELIGKQPKTALQSLERVFKLSPKNSAALIHAAMASRELEDETSMLHYYLDALTLGLNESLLSPRDREFCGQMSDYIDKLDQPATSLTAQSNGLSAP